MGKPDDPQSSAASKTLEDGLPFVPPALDDLGLDPLTFRVYCRIVRRAGVLEDEHGNKRRGECFESVVNIAAAVGAWRPIVTRAVRQLEELGLVQVVRRIGQTLKITLPPATAWRKTNQGGIPTRAETRLGVGMETDQPPGRKTAHKGSTVRINPKDQLSGSPAARRVASFRLKPAAKRTTATTTTTATAAGKVLEVAVLSPGAAPSWSREACDDWIARFEGTAPGGPIGKALKPLVTTHGWSEVREAWRSYLAQIEAEYASPAKFASTYGRWSGTAAPARRQSLSDRNADVLAAWVGKEGA